MQLTIMTLLRYFLYCDMITLERICICLLKAIVCVIKEADLCVM